MPFDLTVMPAVFDAVHVALAGLVLFLLLLCLVLAFVSVFALSRRSRAEPVAAPSAALVTPNLAEPARVERPQPVVMKEVPPDAALQLLGLLQQEARFLDFVQENIAGHADADIGAAVRVVHEGCRKVIQRHIDLEPVRTESEGSRLTLPKGFDPAAVRITGHIVGEPPFTGTLIHRGWRAATIKLPKVAEGHDVSVIAPAEVEL